MFIYIYYTGYISDLIKETIELYVHAGSTVTVYQSHSAVDLKKELQ